jgi:beta-glucosidase
MRQPPSLTMRRLRLFLGSTTVVGLAAAFVNQASCARLHPELTSVPGSSNGDGGLDTTSVRDLNEEPADQVLDGGLPTVTATACSAPATGEYNLLSHTPGILPDGGLLDISSATGYTPDPSVAQAAAAALAQGQSNATVYANQMHGNIPNTKTTDIYRTEDDPMDNIKGLLFRDGPRGVNIDAPVYLGTYGSQPLNLGNTPYATTFPVPSARAATWDLDLEARIGEDLGDEILGSENTQTISPCVNILRNPAWGRSQETYGEDPFALGRMGSAFVHGAQQYVPACAKHFAANNIEASRQNLVAIMDSQTLHEIYGRHFEMIIQDGGVACVMASYNSLQVTDGPDTAQYKNAINPVLLKGILRGTFGFKGFIMSDFWAMPPFQTLGLQSSIYEANATAGLTAQLDLEMPWSMNYGYLTSVATTPALEQQLATSATYIVEQKLRFKIADPGAKNPGLKVPETSLELGYGVTNNGHHVADAELQAEEAMVLLKNEPAIVGGQTGDSGGTAPADDAAAADDGAMAALDGAMAVIDGAIPNDGALENDGASENDGATLASDGAPADDGATAGGGGQEGGQQTGGGQPGSGPNVLPIDTSTVHSIAVVGALVPWYTSYYPMGGTIDFAREIRVGDLGSSRVNPDPSLTAGPADGITAAAKLHGITNVTIANTAADAVAANADFYVVMAGMTPQDEGEDYTGASDRADSNGNPNYSLDAKVMAMEKTAPQQDALIEAVAALHKPMVVVLEGGSAINMPWLDQVPAVVMAWYPGQQGGTALGRLLFGDVNFSGKLPITWPKSEADEPTFNTAGSMNGATQMDYYLGYRRFDQMGITPLFPYGWGLSYTTFSYSFIGIPCTTVPKNGVVNVQVAVTNTGTAPGTEVSFLFVSLPASSDPNVHRSVKDLKGFHRSTSPIMPGQTVLFTIPIRVADLKYWSTANGAWAVDSGTYKVMVGSRSDNLPLTGSFQVQ